MTKAEATYWKEYIERVITSRLSTLTNVEIDAAQIRTFADRHMELITGQQLLPQTIFRIFVEEFAPISKWQEELAEQMDEFHGPYELLTDAEMDAIFGIVTPENTMWLDDNGILHTPFEVVDGVLKTNLSVNDNILN